MKSKYRDVFEMNKSKLIADDGKFKLERKSDDGASKSELSFVTIHSLIYYRNFI